MARFAFACLLACDKGYLACFVFKPFSLSTLLLVSIPLIGFSVTVPLVVAAHRVAMDTVPPSPCLITARLHQPFRHQLPSSSTVDQFHHEFEPQSFLSIQCRPELSELRRRVLYAAKTRMRVFLDASKCARFCHCYSSP